MSEPDYPAPLHELVAALRALPGLGPRSAERIALYLAGRGRDHAARLVRAVNDAAALQLCRQCGFFSLGDLCGFCMDPRRDARLLCVVEQPTDVLPLERTGVFNGVYHTLGGRLSPLEGVQPEDLRIGALMERVRTGPPEEIVIALSGDVEGEATANYVAAALKESGVRITRLAQGMPAGLGLEHADRMTLHNAFRGRTAYER